MYCKNVSGIDLSKVNFIDTNSKGDGYDLSFWLSDGSIPLLHARNNFLHFQMPFRDVGGRSLLTKMKLIRVKKIVCNSNFTKYFIDDEFGIDSTVLYPPVDTKLFHPKRKENMILYVGRFSQLTQRKGQDILIKAFGKLVKKGINDWNLVLAGGVEVGVDNLNVLKGLIDGLNVEIIESPSLIELKNLFGRSRFFWSASGFGVDNTRSPQMVEHFGIAPVESMSAGCIPFLFNAGGHKEIVEDGSDGYLYNTIDELVEKSIKVINNKKLLTGLSSKAKIKSEQFSVDVFSSKLKEILL